MCFSTFFNNRDGCSSADGAAGAASCGAAKCRGCCGPSSCWGGEAPGLSGPCPARRCRGCGRGPGRNVPPPPPAGAPPRAGGPGGRIAGSRVGRVGELVVRVPRGAARRSGARGGDVPEAGCIVALRLVLGWQRDDTGQRAVRPRWKADGAHKPPAERAVNFLKVRRRTQRRQKRCSQGTTQASGVASRQMAQNSSSMAAFWAGEPQVEIRSSCRAPAVVPERCEKQRPQSAYVLGQAAVVPRSLSRKASPARSLLAPGWAADAALAAPEPHGRPRDASPHLSPPLPRALLGTRLLDPSRAGGIRVMLWGWALRTAPRASQLKSRTPRWVSRPRQRAQPDTRNELDWARLCCAPL